MGKCIPTPLPIINNTLLFVWDIHHFDIGRFQQIAIVVIGFGHFLCLSFFGSTSYDPVGYCQFS